MGGGGANGGCLGKNVLGGWKISGAGGSKDKPYQLETAAEIQGRELGKRGKGGQQLALLMKEVRSELVCKC